NLRIDSIQGCRTDRRFVHAALAHSLSNHRLELLFQIVLIPVRSEILDQHYRIRDLQHHDGMKTDRYAIRGHRVVHLSIELLRLHVDINAFSRDSCERSSRLDWIRIDSAMAKNPRFFDQYDFMPGIRRLDTQDYQPQ